MIISYNAATMSKVQGSTAAEEEALISPGEEIDESAEETVGEAAAVPEPDTVTNSLGLVAVAREGVLQRIDGITDRIAEGRPLPSNQELLVVGAAGVGLTLVSGAVARMFGARAGIVGAAMSFGVLIGLDVVLKRALAQQTGG